MKKIIRLIVTAAVIIIGVLLFNTLMLKSKQVASENLEKIALLMMSFKIFQKGCNTLQFLIVKMQSLIQQLFLVFIVFLKKLSH